MPTRCCVPYCKGNYDSSPIKVSVFQFPRDQELCDEWLKAISRENFQPTKQSRVCELHFHKSDILRETSQYISKTGETLTVSLRVPRLNTGAIPAIFPGMGRKCCALGCKSNYQNEPTYTTVFTFPRDPERRQLWLANINRKDYEPSPTAVICIKHFEEKYLIREDHFLQKDGTDWVVKRKRVLQAPDAVPTIFEEVPESVLKKLRGKSKKNTKKMLNAIKTEDDSNGVKDASFIQEEEIKFTDLFGNTKKSNGKSSSTVQSTHCELNADSFSLVPISNMGIQEDSTTYITPDLPQNPVLCSTSFIKKEICEDIDPFSAIETKQEPEEQLEILTAHVKEANQSVHESTEVSRTKTDKRPAKGSKKNSRSFNTRKRSATSKQKSPCHTDIILTDAKKMKEMSESITSDLPQHTVHCSSSFINQEICDDIDQFAVIKIKQEPEEQQEIISANLENDYRSVPESPALCRTETNKRPTKRGKKCSTSFTTCKRSSTRIQKSPCHTDILSTDVKKLKNNVLESSLVKYEDSLQNKRSKKFPNRSSTIKSKQKNEDSSDIPSTDFKVNDYDQESVAFCKDRNLVQDKVLTKLSTNQNLASKTTQKPQYSFDKCSLNENNQLNNFSQESPSTDCVDLFQPPVFIKDEIMSEEEL